MCFPLYASTGFSIIKSTLPTVHWARLESDNTHFRFHCWGSLTQQMKGVVMVTTVDGKGIRSQTILTVTTNAGVYWTWVTKLVRNGFQQVCGHCCERRHTHRCLHVRTHTHTHTSKDAETQEVWTSLNKADNMMFWLFWTAALYASFLENAPESKIKD